MIVGAGIIGCYLGKKLKGAEIWEKDTGVIEKPCGGLLSKKGLESLDIDFKESIVNEVKGARFFSKKESFEVHRHKTVAYVIDRLKLQQILARDALDAGCVIKYGNRWNNDITQQTDVTIGADGAFSSVMRSCGIERKYVHTYQIQATISETMDREFVELYFDKELAPGFFAWVIPLDEHRARIGLGCTEGNPKQLFDKFCDKIKVKKIEKEQSAPIPIFDPSTPAVIENKALVGDSAGQVKATTGGGIIFGCKCAEILAWALKKGDLQLYEKQWRKQYERDLKIHLKIREYLNRQDYDSLFRKARENHLDELLEKHGDMDHSAKLVKQILKRPKLWPEIGKMLLNL